MSQEIEEIELSIEAAKEMVERGKAAERLATNPDFKKLVLDGYFRDEAARLAHLLTDPHPEAVRNRENIENDIKGIGAFKRFLTTLVQMGQIAAHNIQEANETLDEIRAEELEASEA